MNYSEIRKFVAPEFLFGKDSRLLAGRYFQNYQIRQLLVVTDPVVSSMPWYNAILMELNEAGLEYSVFMDVSPNPLDAEVMQGTEIYRSNNCQGILAIGGGSVIDCAKGIGIVCSNSSHILNFEGVDQIDTPTPPIICIPTTAGASADVSQFAIIRDTQKLKKVAIISKMIVPDLALIDPIVTQTMDPYLTACTGIDALTHAIEAFVSTGHSIITDNRAMNAIDLIVEYLPKVLKDLTDIDARFHMMMGSLEAGLAFSNASLGAVHAMAHSLGGYYNLAHGECNSILLHHTINYNFNAVEERYKKIMPYFSDYITNPTGNLRTDLVNSVHNFTAKQGIKSGFGDKGVSSDLLPHLAKNALNDPCIVTNPRDAVQRDLEVILEESM
ncbi:MAG: iron-containing alcohol dehydrogenase [Marinilabiliaceae bacterium]|nr:iron-containing alcohol dehydrogenase [Marinilabiliaceae bacterium]